MRLAHLFPERKPQAIEFATHHELHLREEEALALTRELMDLTWSEHTSPMVAKVFALLADRNSKSPVRATLPSEVTYSYPSGRSTTMAEVKGARMEQEKGAKVEWVQTNSLPLKEGFQRHGGLSGRQWPYGAASCTCMLCTAGSKVGSGVPFVGGDPDSPRGSAR
jgi:hypothetical protein